MVNLRKRQATDAPSQYAEQGSDDAESGSDEEEKMDAQRQKATGKKALTPKRRKTSKAEAEVDLDTPLLELVRTHPQALSTAAKEWVEGYQQHRAGATAQLLTLLAQASGCSMEITEDDVDEGEIDKVAKALSQHVVQNGFEDHFKGKAGKDFRANYLEFWDKVMRECQAAEVLWDNFLLDKVSMLAIVLSCSVVRNFRYAATLTACQLVSSWVRTMHTLTEARDTAQRQLDAEGKKKANKAASGRVESFQKVIDRSHSQFTSLKAYVRNTFQAVSAKRFRDVAPEIRGVVIEGIADWTNSLPAEFLQDQYLKYVAWALSDRDASVRETAVTALLELYDDEEKVAPMHELTERFTPRFAQLIHDVDEGVAVKGVQLLTLLVRLDEVPAKQVRDVYKLLLDDSYAIRHAAAELVADMLEESGERHLGQVGKATAGRGRKRKSDDQASKQELQLAGLLHVMFLLANDEEEDADLASRRRQSAAGLRGAEQPLSPVMVAHVVDALFDRVEILSDWKALAAALLEDTAAEARSDASTSNLILLLKDAAHKATGGQLVPSRQEARKQGSKARQTASASHKQDLTLALTTTLPNLIQRYQTDALKAGALVSIVPDLNLDMYSLKRQESTFEELIRAVAGILCKHVEPDTVAHCVCTMVHCTDHGPEAIQTHAQMGLAEVVEEQVQKLAAAVTDVVAMSEADLEDAVEAYRGGDGQPSQEDEGLFACRAALLRLHHLQLLCKSPAESADFYTSLHKLVEAAAGGMVLGEPITELALLNTFTLLLWQLQSLQQQSGPTASSSAAESAEALGQKVLQFCAHMDDIYEANEGLQRIRDSIFRIQADLFLLFSSDKLEGTPAQAACYTPDEASLQRLWEHCEAILSCAVVELPEPSIDADTQEQRAALAKLEQDAEADNKMKCEALCAVGRLVAFQSLTNDDWLGPQLVSHMVGHGKQVSDLVKDICRSLKKQNAAGMPDMYLQAMQNAFQRHLNDQGQGTLQEFAALCARVAQTYAGFNTSATALLHIAKGGVSYALEGIPSKLPFLKGLAQVCARIPARQAELLLEHIQQSVSGISPDEADADWQDYFDLLALTQDRTAKGGQPRSALKGSAAKKASKQRISFGRQEGTSDNDEDGSSDHGHPEEEEPQGTADAIEEDAEPAAPSSGWKMRARGPSRSPLSARAKSSSAPRSLSRFASQMTASPIPSGMQDEPDLIVPDESAHPSGGDAEGSLEGSEASDQIEERSEQEAGGEEEEDAGFTGSDVMPTEEQLPGINPSSSKKPRRTMQRLYDDTNDHEPSSDAAPESSGDADLRVDPFGSNTQSDQPASAKRTSEAMEEEQEEDQEPAPQPRRRRRI